MPYSKEEYLRNYEQLNDDELEQVLADKKDLVPEAVVALEIVVQRRHITQPMPPEWVRSPERTEPVRSLEDYDDYNRLRDHYRFMRRWCYLIAIGPFFQAVAVARKSLDRFDLLVYTLLIWAIAWSLCGTVFQFRHAFYECPQCSSRFGGGKECRSCGFPRSKEPAKLGLLGRFLN